KSSLEPAMEAVEAVIITIRLNPDQIQKGRTYQDVEGNGIMNVVEVAKQKGVKKIVLISADGVGPDCLSDMYQAKFQSEEAIRNSGMDYTIFQSSGLFKDIDFFFIPNVLKLGETDTWPFGPADIHMSPLSRFDLAKCMVDAVENPAASNKTLSVGGPDCITQRELLNMIAKEAGVNANYTKGVSKEQLIERVKSNPEKSFFTAEQLQDFIMDSKIDHNIIKEIFGVEFQRVGDYIKETVPKVKAAMVKQGK
ncbi:MAG: NAD(P)H-binding protein, partial [Deltaproteobacteria bacterium]|nr:NAD(P)H-binding protein [Deltaproteobacteria bacterium]